jgi:hypothetical protein
MHGRRWIAVTGALVFLVAGCATTTVRETRVVNGRITEESGQAVANSPVVIVGRSLELNAARLEYEERGRKELRAVTDSEGRYRLEFIPEALGNNLFLFFYDKTGFDRVRYRRPEPLDITPLIDRDRRITLNQVLQYHPAWPEVQRQIAFYGSDSDRARILRKHGLPERRETSRTGATETEAWWYYADGVSYWFSADKLIRTHEFQPIPGARPAQ